MTTLLPAALMTKLTLKAEAEIDAVLRNGSARMLVRPNAEVGFVAAFILEGVNRIASTWAPELGLMGYSLKMQGVFCHAAPVVDFLGPSGEKLGCELADLLVVTDFTDASGRMTRRASLIQAKMAGRATQVLLTGQSSLRQMHLYQNWPNFSFRDSTYGTKSYSLAHTGKGISGSVGVIDRHFKKSTKHAPTWTQHDATPTPFSTIDEPTLGAFLVGMIAGPNEKFGRSAVAHGPDDWSTVVDLLLRETYTRSFRHKPTLGDYSPSRGVTALAFMSAPAGLQPTKRHISALFALPPFDGIEVVKAETPGGISILRLEIEQN
jgi:hypothetical protein